MLFTGDIAQPQVGASLFVIPNELKGKTWIGNLEGSLVDVSRKKENVSGVYNDVGSIRLLQEQFPFTAFNIANNHLLDSADVRTTIENAKLIGVPTVGAGYNLLDAQRPLLLTDRDGTTYRILSFGWENIQCVPAGKSRVGVNPYTRKHVLKCVFEALKHEEPVICFMHWNYELEKYPQPFDRQLAMELIDMGVAAIISCHAHRVQPIEFYKGKPIVYGLGNFLFCQGYYFGGKLCFPKFCEEEYAFEISSEGYKLHYFQFDQIENKLKYVKSADICEDKEFDGKAEFTGYYANEYEKFFTKNRVQKKLLPIFHAKESPLSYWIKSEWIKLRGWMLDTAMKLNLKSAKRGDR